MKILKKFRWLVALHLFILCGCSETDIGYIEETEVLDFSYAETTETATETTAETAVTAYENEITDTSIAASASDITDTDVQASDNDENQNYDDYSLEISDAETVDELIEEFNKRHGYDLPVHDYMLYDIDGDNKEELLLLSYGVLLYGCSELHVYRITDNGFKYCGQIVELFQCELNDNINDRGTDFKGYEKLDIKQFHYTDDFTYNCVLASSVRTYNYQNNYIYAITFDSDDMIKAIPIMMWGVDVSFDHLGMVLTEHSYFYGNGTKEEISEDEVQYYLSFLT
ncbi:MAG: hypothetical protein K2N72_04475 [Oscillospiraceae bacterium]|nr:hypothetical protein [Oscillospiraceae bacterium]